MAEKICSLKKSGSSGGTSIIDNKIMWISSNAASGGCTSNTSQTISSTTDSSWFVDVREISSITATLGSNGNIMWTLVDENGNTVKSVAYTTTSRVIDVSNYDFACLYLHSASNTTHTIRKS